jgi:predicted porin
MNKKLVALGVAGAFALPLAAQAQTANVTLYGRANVDLEFVNGTTCPGAGADGGGQLPVVTNCPGGTSNPTVARVSSNSSRIGVRGTEALGGGLNAVFQMEANVSWDTGNSSSSGLASRESFVGLQGSWGRVIMGNFLAPQDDLHAIFGNAPTLLTSILATSDVWAQGNVSKQNGGWDDRLGNSIRYDSPNFAGFTFAFQASTRDGSGFSNANSGDHASEVRHAWVFGENIIYKNGPLQVGFSGEQNRKVRSYAITTQALYPGYNCNGALASAANPCTFDANDTDWTVTGAWDFGNIFQGFGLRIGGVYEQTKYDTPSGDLKRNFWGVSLTSNLGAGKIYAFFGQADDGKGGAQDGERVGYVVHGSDTGTRQWEITYSYSLSPRTLLYTGYVKLLNDTYNPTTFNINSYPISTCAFGSQDCSQGRPGGFVLGMVHFF